MAERPPDMSHAEHFNLAASDMLADPLADDTMAAIIGAWPVADSHLDTAALGRIGLVNRLMASWETNSSLRNWQAPEGTDPIVAQSLQAYLRQGAELPAWADRAKVERSENIFIENGPLSCTLLFCASLPECYVLPNLADVLHIAGQLEAHTEHRIRQTAAMIFPVMLRGGLMADDGYGLAQILKVRLIHATIRHLILRGSPQDAHGVVIAIRTNSQPRGMHDALMRHGWDVHRQGLPCNQSELAYTLLTFGYVFLRGLRTLGQGLSSEDEQAYLHTWNVMGHVLSIQSHLLASSMEEAKTMFTAMQEKGRKHVAQPDVRPALGQALVNTMARSLVLPGIARLPVPMTQWLVGEQTARDIGLAQPADWFTRCIFVMLMSLVRGVDAVGRIFSKKFSISRFITRILGYHLITKLLMDQTRPLALPDQVLKNLHHTVAQFGHDTKAHDWLNRLEDRYTTTGLWSPEKSSTIR